jgi:hypothetical protein
MWPRGFRGQWLVRTDVTWAEDTATQRCDKSADSAAGPLEKRHAQEMLCHSKCLTARLHPAVHFYAAFLAEQDGLSQGESAGPLDEV